MALSPKLKTKAPVNEEELIRKGGSSGSLDETTTQNEERDFKRVQVRIPLHYLSRIDKLLVQRPGNTSRHTWLIEAIAEKIGKEESSTEVNLTSSQP